MLYSFIGVWTFWCFVMLMWSYFVFYSFFFFFFFVEPPLTIVRKMEDQKFPDGALISLECELSRHNVDVKWLKVSTWFHCSLLLLSWFSFLGASNQWFWCVSFSLSTIFLLSLCLWYIFQDGVDVKASRELRIYSMGRKRFLQLMKCRVKDSGVYTCDAGDAATSCNVDVYGKKKQKQKN